MTGATDILSILSELETITRVYRGTEYAMGGVRLGMRLHRLGESMLGGEKGQYRQRATTPCSNRTPADHDQMHNSVIMNSSR